MSLAQTVWQLLKYQGQQNMTKIFDFTFCGFSQKAPMGFFPYAYLWKAEKVYIQELLSV